jgi:nucleotide-binding universal stress UspA family protein
MSVTSGDGSPHRKEAGNMTTPRTQRIIVGVDGSDESKHALRWAARLAETLHLEITAVTAWHFPVAYGVGGIPMDWDPSQDMTKCLIQAVDDVFGSERPAGLELLVSEGNAAQVLLDCSQDAVMLVVGSRGHGGFAGLLLGSVSSSVAEHATCPVFVVHGDRTLPADG